MANSNVRLYPFPEVHGAGPHKAQMQFSVSYLAYDHIAEEVILSIASDTNIEANRVRGWG
jgi:hypothetical protein